MAGRLVWDQVGERQYETGTDRGVVYPYNNAQKQYGVGEAWNGLRSVSESPDGAEETALYADNIKYLSMFSAENFKGSIGAYTYPDSVAILDGTQEVAAGVTVGQQDRGLFGFAYRTLIGNDTEKNNHGYKLHLVYGATLSPSEREYNSVNDSPEAVELSWDFTTTPVDIPGFKPSAHIIIDSTKVNASELATFETILYGSESEDPRLPLPAEVIASFAKSSDVHVTDLTVTPETVSVKVGETQQLTAAVTPSNASNKTVNYVSSDSTVATVDASGLLTGRKTGSATITITTVDGGFTDTVNVTVTAAN